MTNRSRISKQNKKELRPASFAPLTEALAQENERYEACHRMALKLMEKGFHLGGTPSLPEKICMSAKFLPTKISRPIPPFQDLK
jgi:hypothetical protein